MFSPIKFFVICVISSGWICLGYSINLGRTLQIKKKLFCSHPLSELPPNSVSGKAQKEANRNYFDWTKQWYPIAVESFTDRSRPNKMQLLGNDFVLWFDGNSWRAFDDACPHRGVPLSEGRIEKTGELLCAYHAWRFDGEGKCTSIPQSRTKEKEEALKANANACVRSYPTQVAQGLIWCWGQMGLPGSNVTLEAALKPPLLIEELADPQYVGRILPFKWNFRDLPYGWDFFMENTLDPAHVVVSHHGIVGNRYKDPTYLNLTRVPSRTEIPISEGGLYNSSYPEDVGFNHLVEDTNTITAAEAVNGTSGQFVSRSYNDFRPPCLNKIERCSADGSKLILALYATPTKPGFCRHIGAQVLIKGKDNKIPQGLGAFAIPMPTWILHLTASLFLHQDQVFLHHQERKLYHTARYAFGRFPPNMFSGALSAAAPIDQVGNNTTEVEFSLRNDPKSYASRHFTPNEHDLGISNLRQWIHRQASGGPVWGGAALAQGLPPVLLPEKLFDVYHSHVESCTVCQAALRNTKRARNAALGVLFALAFFWRPPRRVRNIVAVVAGVTVVAAQTLKKYFYVFKYSHQDND